MFRGFDISGIGDDYIAVGFWVGSYYVLTTQDSGGVLVDMTVTNYQV